MNEIALKAEDLICDALDLVIQLPQDRKLVNVYEKLEESLLWLTYYNLQECELGENESKEKSKNPMLKVLKFPKKQ